MILLAAGAVGDGAGRIRLGRMELEHTEEATWTGGHFKVEIETNKVTLAKIPSNGVYGV